MSRILNIAAYRFVALADAAALRLRLEQSAAAHGLKGTILLAEEGINLFLAGAADNVRCFLSELRSDDRFAGLPTKDSWSDEVPFRRLQVKHKREIIRMNHPSIRPASGRAHAVKPATLARWLDAGHDDHGRPLLLLDTRNRFEVEQGRFRDATDLQTTRFGEFPAAALSRRTDFAGKTVVSYCTGGIRCEKAALFLAEAGVADIWQLDGGILAYFEQVGSRHFDGDCVVFDQRIAVDSRLRPTV